MIKTFVPTESKAELLLYSSHFGNINRLSGSFPHHSVRTIVAESYGKYP
ncbi:MAG: hypothetical protein RBQ66_02330 [Candidatus Cloacimonadaceae bacterium]|nr:hypothetical protein [Candidatus Cloacimonadota bacterium]MDY0298647.1 hypothetical protein [Candidatus Cloacimonadaceae bacterium]